MQRLRDALGEPAVLLALDEQRVQDPPAVVDGDVPERRDPPGLGVDLDDRQVRPEREGRAVLRGVEADVQLLPVAAACRCTSLQLTVDPPGTPATPKVPSPVISMSSAAASSRCAASLRARSWSSCAASDTAVPPSCSDREPPVPAPRGTSAVSDWT